MLFVSFSELKMKKQPTQGIYFNLEHDFFFLQWVQVSSKVHG